MKKKKNLPALINDQVRDLELQNLRLVAQIRQMDQEIYKMGQCLDWITMRPIFQALHKQTMERMADESDRIRRLLVPEIQKTYNTKINQLQLPKSKE